MDEFPDLRLRVVGSGWWEAELHAYAADQVRAGSVVFEGHVSEVRKQEIYEESWLMALPSMKEGWGLVVGEAAAHRTPTVAYASAGGTRESIVDGVSGAPGRHRRSELTAALGSLLRDADGAPAARRRCGRDTARATPGRTRSRRSHTSWRRACAESWSATRTPTEE